MVNQMAPTMMITIDAVPFSSAGDPFDSLFGAYIDTAGEGGFEELGELVVESRVNH